MVAHRTRNKRRHGCFLKVGLSIAVTLGITFVALHAFMASNVEAAAWHGLLDWIPQLEHTRNSAAPTQGVNGTITGGISSTSLLPTLKASTLAVATTTGAPHARCVLEPAISGKEYLHMDSASLKKTWNSWPYTCSMHARRSAVFLENSAQRCVLEEANPRRWRLMLGEAEAPFSVAQRFADVPFGINILSTWGTKAALWGSVGAGKQVPTCSGHGKSSPFPNGSSLGLSKHPNAVITLRGMLCEQGKEKMTWANAQQGRWTHRETCIVKDMYPTEGCGRTPSLPPPSSSPLLDALADKKPMAQVQPLLQAALARLDRLLHSRATLCDDSRRCFIQQWPCAKKGKSRSFVTLYPSKGVKMDSAPNPNLNNSDCLLVCTAPLPIDKIKTSNRSNGDFWEYIISKDGYTCREPDTVTPDKVCRTGCYLYNLRQLAAWRQTKVTRGPFFTREDAVKNSWPTEVLSMVPPARTFPQQSLRRCAVMGSSHAIRCGSSWGPAIDKEYSAIFRVNDGDYKDNMKPCKAGTRTDFHVDFRRNQSKGETRWLLRAPPCSIIVPTIIHSTDLPHLVNEIRRKSPRMWKVLLPNAVGHSWGQGSGSGAIAQAVALSLCRSVDVFGYGLFKGEGNDLRYIHHYDKIPTFPMSGHEVMQSELRNIIFDAFGLWNFIWW